MNFIRKYLESQIDLATKRYENEQKRLDIQQEVAILRASVDRLDLLYNELKSLLFEIKMSPTSPDGEKVVVRPNIKRRLRRGY